MIGSLPPVLRVGQARVTAGLDRTARLGLRAHRAVFGAVPWTSAGQLISMAEQVDLRGRAVTAFPVARKLRAVCAASRPGKRRPAVVVDCTDAEPGSRKDVMLLLRSPHLVLDGAALTARALDAREIVVAVAGDGLHVRSVCDAVVADNTIRHLARVVSVPDGFLSGESGALVSALNAMSTLRVGLSSRYGGSGVMPTMLSSAETFAQVAVLAMLGPARYASAGAPDEPGTVLLTVGGTVERPAVVETPTGMALGRILDVCRARQAQAVLVGGYGGMWLTAESANDLLVSRADLAAAGGTLGAGVVLVLGQDSCPLGELARAAGYLAVHSSGQCGSCKLGLPAIARSLAAMASGAGGADEVGTVRRASAGARGRAARHHSGCTAKFVTSALDVFADDVAEHLFRGGCGRAVRGVLPISRARAETRLTVDRPRSIARATPARLTPAARVGGRPRPGTSTVIKQAPPRPALTRRARLEADLAGAKTWIAELRGS